MKEVDSLFVVQWKLWTHCGKESSTMQAHQSHVIQLNHFCSERETIVCCGLGIGRESIKTCSLFFLPLLHSVLSIDFVVVLGFHLCFICLLGFETYRNNDRRSFSVYAFLHSTFNSALIGSGVPLFVSFSQSDKNLRRYIFLPQPSVNRSASLFFSPSFITLTILDVLFLFLSAFFY